MASQAQQTYKEAGVLLRKQLSHDACAVEAFSSKHVVDGPCDVPGEAERGGAAAGGAWNCAGPQRRAAPPPRRVSCGSLLAAAGGAPPG